MNEINIDFLGNGQTLKSFKFSNDKINAVLGLKDSIRKYIIDLLLKKQEGEQVIIDDQNLKNVNEDSLLKNITLVSKSGILLNLSIYDNLTLENPQATTEEVQ